MDRKTRDKIEGNSSKRNTGMKIHTNIKAGQHVSPEMEESVRKYVTTGR